MAIMPVSARSFDMREVLIQHLDRMSEAVIAGNALGFARGVRYLESVLSKFVRSNQEYLNAKEKCEYNIEERVKALASNPHLASNSQRYWIEHDMIVFEEYDDLFSFLMKTTWDRNLFGRTYGGDPTITEPIEPSA